MSQSNSMLTFLVLLVFMFIIFLIILSPRPTRLGPGGQLQPIPTYNIQKTGRSSSPKTACPHHHGKEI